MSDKKYSNSVKIYDEFQKISDADNQNKQSNLVKKQQRLHWVVLS